MAVYACSDLHGFYEIYEKIKAFLNPEDIVYFLGDAGDRGPQSWECIKAIYNDPQFIYLKGNHEDMLVKAIQEYFEDYMWHYETYNICRYNGGEQTMLSWELDPDRQEWYTKLALLPTWTEYTNPKGQKFILSHAGFTPWLEDDEEYCIIPDNDSLIWGRKHIYDDKFEPAEMEDIISAHGHTPTQYLCYDALLPWREGAYWYMDGHKVDIDTGGMFTGNFCLLNLDTLEDIIFKSSSNLSNLNKNA